MEDELLEDEGKESDHKGEMNGKKDDDEEDEDDHSVGTVSTLGSKEMEDREDMDEEGGENVNCKQGDDDDVIMLESDWKDNAFPHFNFDVWGERKGGDEEEDEDSERVCCARMEEGEMGDWEGVWPSPFTARFRIIAPYETLVNHLHSSSFHLDPTTFGEWADSGMDDYLVSSEYDEEEGQKAVSVSEEEGNREMNSRGTFVFKLSGDLSEIEAQLDEEFLELSQMMSGETACSNNHVVAIKGEGMLTPSSQNSFIKTLHRSLFRLPKQTLKSCGLGRKEAETDDNYDEDEEVYESEEIIGDQLYCWVVYHNSLYTKQVMGLKIMCLKLFLF